MSREQERIARLEAALRAVRPFLEEELECREQSMLPVDPINGSGDADGSEQDPDRCYVCDRPADDCACELDPNGPLPQSACVRRAERLERAEQQIERQRENS